MFPPETRGGSPYVRTPVGAAKQKRQAKKNKTVRCNLGIATAHPWHIVIESPGVSISYMITWERWRRTKRLHITISDWSFAGAYGLILAASAAAVHAAS